MVLSPKRSCCSKASIDGGNNRQQQQGHWLSQELFLENFGDKNTTENGFASNKQLESVLQASDLANRQRSAAMVSGKGAIHDESRRRQDVEEAAGTELEMVDKGVVVEEGTGMVAEDKGVEFEQPRTKVEVEDKEVESEQPKVEEGHPEVGFLDQPAMEGEENGEDDDRKLGKPGAVLGVETTPAKFPEENEEALKTNAGSKEEEAAGSQPGEEETTKTTAAATTTSGQGKVAVAEDKNAVVVQGSLMSDDGKTTSSSATIAAAPAAVSLSPPAPAPPEDEATNKEDLVVVDERIDTLSPRRRDRILKQQQQRRGGPSRASQDFDDGGGEDADVAPLPFSGPISLSGYSGPMSGGSISRRSDGSSTSTRSFAFPVLPYEWNSSPARMPPPTKKRSYWRNKREWCLRCFCCTQPSTHP